MSATLQSTTGNHLRQQRHALVEALIRYRQSASSSETQASADNCIEWLDSAPHFYAPGLHDDRLLFGLCILSADKSAVLLKKHAHLDIWFPYHAHASEVMPSAQAFAEHAAKELQLTHIPAPAVADVDCQLISIPLPGAADEDEETSHVEHVISYTGAIAATAIPADPSLRWHNCATLASDGEKIARCVFRLLAK